MKKLLAAATLSLSMLAYAADPPMNEPKKTEMQPSAAGLGEMKSQIPAQEPLVETAKVASGTKDQECLAKLHHDNEMEIQMGRMAKKNGASKDIRAFGDLLIKDHSLADKQVMATAKREKIDLTLPASKDEAEAAERQEMKDTMARLEMLKGEEFDREFAKMMVGDHEKAVTMVEGTLTSTQNAKVKVLLEKLLPVLKEHKRVAEGINKRVQSV